MRQSVLSDLPRMLDTTVPARKLFCHTPAFMDRYFWIEDMVSEVDHFHRSTSNTWHKVTAGQQDDGSLLTLFLCVAAGATPKTLPTRKKRQSPGAKNPQVRHHARMGGSIHPDSRA